MGRMVRKQLNIDEDLDRALGDVAVKRGVSQSQLVREALEGYLADAVLLVRDKERAEAWAQIEANWAKLDALGAPPGAARERTWRREDAYAERLDDLAHSRHKRPGV